MVGVTERELTTQNGREIAVPGILSGTSVLVGLPDSHAKKGFLTSVVDDASTFSGHRPHARRTEIPPSHLFEAQ